MGSGKRRPPGDAQQSMVVCIRCHRILVEHLCAVLREGGREWACCNQCAPNDALRVVRRARNNWRYHLSLAPRQLSKCLHSVEIDLDDAPIHERVCTNCGAMVTP